MQIRQATLEWISFAASATRQRDVESHIINSVAHVLTLLIKVCITDSSHFLSVYPEINSRCIISLNFGT
jgi:hypothetical protein